MNTALRKMDPQLALILNNPRTPLDAKARRLVRKAFELAQRHTRGQIMAGDQWFRPEHILLALVERNRDNNARLRSCLEELGLRYDNIVKLIQGKSSQSFYTPLQLFINELTRLPVSLERGYCVYSVAIALINIPDLVDKFTRHVGRDPMSRRATIDNVSYHFSKMANQG